ncbi:MAG: hypothetical protein Q9160_008776 [Pyrenula sp. 1 TL-2023]
MSTFAFGFSGDDIDTEDIDGDNGIAANLAEVQLAKNDETESLIPPQKHELDDLLKTLPSHLSYDLIPLFPQGFTSDNLNPQLTHLPRRSHFDILTQLKAEATPSSSPLIHALTNNDLHPTIYEGGLKTWECSIDLARYLLSSPPFPTENKDEDEDSGNEGEPWHIIELGAGSALPSLALFSSLFLSSPTPSPPHTPQPHPHPLKTHFTLSDYNASALSLSTLPNLILAWWEVRGKHEHHSSTTSSSKAGDTEGKKEAEATFEVESNELPLPPPLLARFRTALVEHGIEFDFVSGAWGEEFVGLVAENATMLQPQTGSVNTLILASETIYNPRTLPVFVQTVRALLSGSSRNAAAAKAEGRAKLAGSRALVAAKKVYFGVGGGVRELVDEVGRQRRNGGGGAGGGDGDGDGDVEVETVWDSDGMGRRRRGGGDQEAKGDEGGGGEGEGGVGRLVLKVSLEGG